MESRKENLKSLFTNNRTRIIIIFTFTILLVGVLIAVLRMSFLSTPAATGQATVANLPGEIRSIPGAANQTAQYVKLQQEQNVKQAASALTTGSSAIPTIIQTQAFGEGVESIKSPGSVGFVALSQRDDTGERGVWYDILKNGNCSKTSLDKALSMGAGLSDLKQACSCKQLTGIGYSLKDLQTVCSCPELREAGFKAADLKANGFDAKRLKACGYSACELKSAGFTAAEMKAAGFSDDELKGAGFPTQAIQAADLPAGVTADEVRKAGCSVDGVKRLREKGVTAAAIKRLNGCSTAQLQAAGFTPEEAGVIVTSAPVADVAEAIKNAGCSIDALKKQREAGISAELISRHAGCSEEALRAAGFPPSDLAAREQAAREQAAREAAERARNELLGRGTEVARLDYTGPTPIPTPTALSTRDVVDKLTAQRTSSQLQQIVNKQQAEMAAQRHQQEIQDKTAAMLGAANTALQIWKTVPTQAYTAGPGEEVKGVVVKGAEGTTVTSTVVTEREGKGVEKGSIVLRTGDIVFAVLDTTVNTDEPSPILATIVSGTLRGSKLIGSFTLPPNANKMVIMFNTLSIPGAQRTNSISAFAIDPETGRTALSGRVDHHYLSRYGSMFAASFLEGFGNAFQSANTTVTIGGTGGGDNITVQNGIGRSTLENAVIGLATVGKSWGQVAQQNMNRPTTIEVFAGTSVGVLFTQDVIIAQEPPPTSVVFR